MREITINDTEPATAETRQQAFLRDLIDHGCGLATREDAVVLTRLAGRHKLLCERQGGTDQGKQASEADRLRSELESDIRLLAEIIGAKDAVFSGDPRGSTVRLVLPDGHTDDRDKSGLCVPTEDE